MRALLTLALILAAGCSSACRSPHLRSDAPCVLSANARELSKPIPMAAALQLVAWETDAEDEQPDIVESDSQRLPPPLPEQLPPPQGQGTGQTDLTLEQAERMAQDYSPALGERAAAVEAARGTMWQVGLGPNPRLGYAGEDIGVEGSAGRHGLFIAQEFVTGNKLQLNRAIAAWQLESAEQQLRTLRIRVLTDVRIAFYEALFAQRRSKLAEELVEVSQKAVQAAQVLFEGQEVGRADPLRARIEAKTARIVLESARNRRLETWRRLAVLIGRSNDQPVQLVDELDDSELELDWSESLHRTTSQNPQLAAALAQVESARWILQREIAQVRPNVDLRATIQHEEISGDAVAGVQFELPVPLYNRNEGAIQRARYDVATAAQAVDRLALQFEARLTAVFQRYSTAKLRAQQYSQEDGILDDAEKSLELLRAGYQAGEFGLLDFLAAQRTYFQTNLDYLDSLQTLWTSAAEIQGLLLKNSLGNNPPAVLQR